MPSRRQVLAAGCIALAGGGAGCSQVRDAVAAANRDDASDETAGDADTGTTGNATPSDDTGGTTTAGGAGEFRITVTTGDGEVVLVTGPDVATVGEVERARTGDGYRIAVTLTDEGSAAFVDELERVGALDDPSSHRIRTYFGGELLYEATLGHDLAHAMKTGGWDGEFLFHVTNRETAAKVREALKAETAGATKTTVETETSAESG